MTTRAERARARQAVQEEEARRQRQNRLAVAGTLLVAVVAIVAVSVSRDKGAGGASTATSGGLLATPPPWPAQAVGLFKRLASLNFPPVGDESYHAHVLVTVYRDGQQVPVPPTLGYNTRGEHSSLHTHTPDGVIHMEADNPYPYELAHVMTAWGVAFDRNRLGSDTTSGTKGAHVYVNGQPAPDVPVVLKDKDNVVVAYGTEDSFPKLPPADALAGV